MELFAYGTLQFPEVLTALLGRVPQRVPAIAPGWRAAALPGRVYPGLVPVEHASAAGLVLGGLHRAELLLLDAYEDVEYRLAVITLAGGRRCPTYVWLTDVLDQDWDAGRFAGDELPGYVTRVAAWRAGYPHR